MLPPTTEWFQGLCERIATRRGWEWPPPWISAEKILLIDDLSGESIVEGVRSIALRTTPDFTDHFFSATWPDLRLAIIAVGDYTVDEGAILKFLERHPNCQIWGTNLVGPDHPRVRLLPLFLANRVFRGGGADLDPPVAIVRSDTTERPIPILATWDWQTHPKRAEWFTQIRSLGRPDIHTYRYLELNDYTEMISQSQAVICPPGNGYDTHRAWETLYSGGWPILFDGYHTRLLRRQYPDIPCIIVESMEELVRVADQLPNCPSPWWPGLERSYWEAAFSAATSAS